MDPWDPGYGTLDMDPWDPGYGSLGIGYPMGWALAIPDGYTPDTPLPHPGYTSPLHPVLAVPAKHAADLTSTLSRFCQKRPLVEHAFTVACVNGHEHLPHAR